MICCMASLAFLRHSFYEQDVDRGAIYGERGIIGDAYYRSVLDSCLCREQQERVLVGLVQIRSCELPLYACSRLFCKNARVNVAYEAIPLAKRARFLVQKLFP